MMWVGGRHWHPGLRFRVSFADVIEISALTIAKVYAAQWEIHNSRILLFDKNVLREPFEMEYEIAR